MNKIINSPLSPCVLARGRTAFLCAAASVALFGTMADRAQALTDTYAPRAPGDVVQIAQAPGTQPEILGGSDDSMPPPAAVAPVPAPAATPPDAAPLREAAPGNSATVTPMPDSVTGDASVARVPAPAEKSDKPDVYYDSTLNVPTGPLSETVGPRKVDPVQEPASKLVTSRINKKASDLESQVVAANRALELGRYESALELFTELAGRNERDPRILMGLAVAQQKVGHDAQAILTYEKLLQIAPNSVDAIVNLTGLLHAQYPEVAMRRLIDLGGKYPGNAGIPAQIGMIHAQAGDHKQALVALGKAAALQPQNAVHLYNMAIVADRMGSSQEAVNYYERALEVDAVYGNGRSVPRESIYDRLARLRR